MDARLARLAPWLILPALAVWVFWLRWPTFGHAFWNLDEGIYATVARVVLEGGVMYRDAIDHRAPVCHHLTAGVFAVAGINNVWAMHAALAAQIIATAWALLLLGRRWRDTATGFWAALVLIAFSTDLFYVGDSYAVSTEWCIAFFSAWSAWWFWIRWPHAGFWGPALAGAGYALAFMSKQPGLLEIGAPAALLAYLVAIRRLTARQAARVLGGLVTGFTIVLASIFAYFWAHDALADFYFYGWTYNLIYYGFGVTAGERLEAALALPNALRLEYPLLLGAVVAAALAALHKITRDQPSPEEARDRPAAVFLLAWLVLSTAGAASAGRIFPHYYIQAFPALAMAAGWFLGSLTRHATAPGRGWVRAGSAALVLIAAWNLLSHPVRGRARPALGVDFGTVPAEFIRRHTKPDERIFVWGLYPDFYVFADRAPASRYIYTSFQTGVQPGRNTVPGEDTSDDAVPGATEALVQELDRTRPVAFVDSSLGPQRLYEKYPLHKFPALAEWVNEHYAEVDARRYRERGFRVLWLKDSSRRAPAVLAGGDTSGELGEPVVTGLPTTLPVRQEYLITASHSGGRLQRIELLVGGEPLDGVSFEPTDGIGFRFPVPFDRLGPGTYRLAVRASAADGQTRTGPEWTVNCALEPVSPEQRAALALPTVTTGPSPARVRAPLGVSAREEAGSWVISAHAPSVIAYPLPPHIARVSGRFGLRPGAYAPDNTGRTDGAEFIIAWVAADGRRTELLRRLLQPVATPADAGLHPFDCFLPHAPEGGTLELITTEGPHGNPASDWCVWSDVLLTPRR